MKTTIILAAIAFFAVACNKTGGDADGGKIIEGIRTTIPGKWKAEYAIDRGSGGISYFAPGNEYEFKIGASDSLYYIFKDTIRTRGPITWTSNNTFLRGTVLAVMNSGTILPPLAVEGIFKDTLYLFELDVQGDSYILSRK